MRRVPHPSDEPSFPRRERPKPPRRVPFATLRDAVSSRGNTTTICRAVQTFHPLFTVGSWCKACRLRANCRDVKGCALKKFHARIGTDSPSTDTFSGTTDKVLHNMWCLSRAWRRARTTNPRFLDRVWCLRLAVVAMARRPHLGPRAACAQWPMHQQPATVPGGKRIHLQGRSTRTHRQVGPRAKPPHTPWLQTPGRNPADATTGRLRVQARLPQAPTRRRDRPPDCP